MTQKRLFHGSKYIIENPVFKGGSSKNDFGNGFYCTDDIVLAKEWGASSNGSGFANEYILDMDELRVFDLTKFDCLAWISVLLKNRDIALSSPIMQSNVDFIIKRYYPKDIEKADVVIGYRADDSYFSWTKDFVRNAIDLEQLESSMNLNNLGLQYFIQSEIAFSKLTYVQSHEIEHIGYFNQKKRRELEANRQYMNIVEQAISRHNGVYASDLPTIDPISKSTSKKGRGR